MTVTGPERSLDALWAYPSDAYHRRLLLEDLLEASDENIERRVGKLGGRYKAQQLGGSLDQDREVCAGVVVQLADGHWKRLSEDRKELKLETEL